MTINKTPVLPLQDDHQNGKRCVASSLFPLLFIVASTKLFSASQGWQALNPVDPEKHFGASTERFVMHSPSKTRYEQLDLIRTIFLTSSTRSPEGKK